MAGAASYRRTQTGWVIIGAMVVAMGLGGGLLARAGSHTLAILIVCAALLVCLLFGTLTITIDDDAFTFRMGVGLVGRRIPLADISSRQAVVNRWYYGWGVRLYPGGWLYTISGLRAVELWLRDGSRIRVGTAEPEAVLGALELVAGPARALSEAEATRARQGGRRYWIVLVGLVLAVGGAVGALFYFELQPPTVEIRESSFTIGSAMYDVEVRLSEVKAISLELSMPAIHARTNGFALGDALRGHFRLEGVGEGHLYVERGRPPFVRVEHSGGYVYLGYANPDLTEAAFESLDRAWRAQTQTRR